MMIQLHNFILNQIIFIYPNIIYIYIYIYIYILMMLFAVGHVNYIFSYLCMGMFSPLEGAFDPLIILFKMCFLSLTFLWHIPAVILFILLLDLFSFSYFNTLTLNNKCLAEIK